MEGIVADEKNEVKEIFTRLRRRDFSGNAGQAVKNSAFQFSTQVAQRIGSLILTIILARVLMPELFGLYNLALSTILIFAAFAELGIGQTLVRFVSRELGKNRLVLAKSTFNYLRRMKVLFVLITSILLIITADFIANSYYHKPLFFALLAGTLYISFWGATTFLRSSLRSFNYFRGVFNSEIVYEISRIVLVPLAAILALKYSLSNEWILFYVIIGLSVSYMFSAIFIWLFSFRKNPFRSAPAKKLGQKRLNETRNFLKATAALSVSGIFFSYIDKIMLGHFVSGEFIGYYSAPISLVGALSAIIGFGSVALLPVFSRITSKRRLERGMKKSLQVLLGISFISFIATLGLAYIIIVIVFGHAYNPSIDILRAMSPLILILPIIGLYSTYFISQGKPGLVAKLLITSTIINIVLNYFFISYLLRFSEIAGVYGAVIATVLSQAFYLGGLIWWRNKNK